ncbi:ABC transporter ATP-binding protein [uncultured Ruegeria sp.]|uniref:ABC transporter ATP-binding protein n=1 Tax=uncultured Ruegeria sp. TaxID=259304 RepID=UPI0026031E92|nr:ABC transporter ATP-binding protein [uncultured Ruegeria sp.]
MIIEVKGLSIHFGALRAVRNVSLSVEAGTIHGIIGESGCGKSITGMAFLGLLPDGARVEAEQFEYAGEDLREVADSLRGHKISLISQDPAAALNPVLSIGTQLDDVLKIHSAGGKKQRYGRAKELLAATGLPDPVKVLKSYPHELSGGMQQRVVIAQALATGADFLIADEPTTALDKTVGKQVLSVLKSLVETRGLTVLMITHDMDVIEYCCTRASVLYAGTTVEDGQTAALLNNPKHPYTRALMNALPGSVPKGQKLAGIKGHPPKPNERIAGCPFADRCPSVMPACADTPPPQHELPQHSWSCHLEVSK